MWLRFALVSSVLTLLFHLIVLSVNGQDPIATPISELSRDRWGALHTAGLILFGLAHIALAVALGKMDSGRLWPIARALLFAGGIGTVYIAYYYVSASESVLRDPAANVPLWIVASLTGTAMGALQPGLARHARRLGIFSNICLGLWLWMIPVFFFVSDGWLGGYERIVGFIYVVWIAGISLGLIQRSKMAPL